MHVLEYGGLTFAYYFGLTGGKLFQSPPPGKFLITASLMAVGFGVTDEIHQFFVPGRSFQVSDLLMDAAGAGFATLTLRVGASRCSGNGQGGDLHV